MGTREQLTAAVDGIYAAATGQGDWHDAIEAVLRASGFTHASAYATNRLVQAAATAEHRLPVTGFWHNHDPRIQADYEREYFKHEPNRHFRLRHPDTRVFYDAMYGSDLELDRNAFYAWAEREAGMRYFMLGQTAPRQSIGVVISLHRGRGAGHVEAAEVERFRLLLDHLDRAVQIEHRIDGALSPQSGALDHLERSPTGVVLLDGMGRVAVANRLARAIAAQDDGLLLTERGVAAQHGGDDARLQRLIGQVLVHGTAPETGGGGYLKLSRPSGRRSYVVLVSPLSRRDSILGTLKPAACVLIADPTRADGTTGQSLRRAYGLTPTEARLAERLTAGDTPAQIAAAQGIAVATVRTHLRAIYRKTETSGQQQLIRLAATLPRLPK